jgi:hypothetical protein
MGKAGQKLFKRAVENFKLRAGSVITHDVVMGGGREKSISLVSEREPPPPTYTHN